MENTTNEADTEIVEEFLNHEGEYPREFFLDLKRNYKFSMLLHPYFLDKSEKKELLTDLQIKNVVEFMSRSHPVTRLIMWSALASSNLSIMIQVYPSIAQNMMKIATGKGTAWKSECPLTPDEEHDLIVDWIHKVSYDLENRNSWLKSHGFIE